jgi:acyl CoA:acetate/3-ketoacid CoA transferase beta subunit
MTRADVCVVALAELFRGDGEILASPMGLLPSLGARLARRTFEPGLLISDGEALLLDGESAVEGWLPYRKVFDVVAHGRRHVVMGANQLDRHGNQNISCIGDHAKPTRQLLGFRGAPGNTVNHRTSYWVPRHGKRVFVHAVDVVSGVGYDRAQSNGAGRFHDVYRVVSNLAVLDFGTEDRTMRLVSLHPGVTQEDVREATGFPLDTNNVTTTRLPTDAELRTLDELDPDGRRHREVPT